MLLQAQTDFESEKCKEEPRERRQEAFFPQSGDLIGVGVLGHQPNMVLGAPRQELSVGPRLAGRPFSGFIAPCGELAWVIQGCTAKVKRNGVVIDQESCGAFGMSQTGARFFNSVSIPVQGFWGTPTSNNGRR